MAMRATFIILLFLQTTFVVFSQNAPSPDSLQIYLDLADKKVSEADWVGAASNYYAAQRFAEPRKDARALCRIQLGRGKMFASSEDNRGLRDACEQALKQCRACGDSGGVAKTYMLSGILMYKVKQLDSAALFFRLGAAGYLQAGDSLRAAGSMAKVGNVLEEQKRYAEALRYYQAFYDFAQKHPDPFYQLTANIYLAGNYLYLNRPDEALRYTMVARRLAQKTKSTYEYSVTLDYEARAYHLMDKYEKAYNALSRYHQFYNDSIISTERVAQIEALKTQYETAQKEATIALQQQQLTQQRWLLLAAGLILFILLTGGGLLFYLWRRLRQRNAEKEFLIKEIHHRVKNNLQVLSSLLHLQSRQIEDEQALDAVREGQNRVDAMGLIHEKLYMGDRLASVEMSDYLQHLGSALQDSFGIDEQRVALRYHTETIHLDVDTAIPLGLIINELLTNSFKYAFPDGRAGAIDVSLRQDEAGLLSLKVSDNGVGRQSDTAQGTAFGSKLIQMLSKKLKGKPEVSTNPGGGYTTLIRFENFKRV